MNLTDSEQRKLLAELYNTTQTKIENVMKKYGLDRVPGDIRELLDKQAKQQGRRRAWWDLFWRAAGSVRKEGDKLFD